jgi:hypothetical protein
MAAAVRSAAWFKLFQEIAMKPNLFACSVFLLGAPALAFAHAPKIGEHGGVQADAGSFHVEVLAKDAKVEVWLHDHSAHTVASAGFKGVAIFKAADGKPVRILLEPASENELTGVSPSPLPAQIEGAVQITTPTGSVVKGKFSAQEAEHESGRETDHAHMH